MGGIFISARALKVVSRKRLIRSKQNINKWALNEVRFVISVPPSRSDLFCKRGPLETETHDSLITWAGAQQTRPFPGGAPVGRCRRRRTNPSSTRPERARSRARVSLLEYLRERH